MKTAILIMILLTSAAAGICDEVKGRVYGDINGKKEPLEAAVVKWINTTKGDITDEKGFFSIHIDGITDKRLVISYIGYLTDTIDMSVKTFIEVTLVQNATTETIEVEERRSSTYLENVTAKTEVISSQELVKEACCDLAGCFGRNASVEVAVTDIITDSKELKMLGLDGVYTQILTDNMPLFEALNVKYGVSSIPGTLIDKITISKGSNSVLHGYESISGIMNVILKNHSNSDKFLANAFMNSMMEKQVNLNYSEGLGTDWSTIGSFHSTQKSNRVDENLDGFLDNPLTTRYMLYNKWDMKNPVSGTEFNIAARYWNEERVGGQSNFEIGRDKGSSTIYGQTADINSIDGYSRLGMKLSKTSNLKAYLSGSAYNQDSYYGITRYDADQRSLHVMSFYETEADKEWIFKAGASYRYLNIDESISFTDTTSRSFAGNYKKLESIPGIFTENSINFLGNRATLNAGIRYDYHNEYGSVITPRGLLRYQPIDDIVIRASAGTGFRTSNVFSEYSSIFASSRDILIPEALDPEKVLNFGADLIYYFQTGEFAGSLNLDYYHTTFFNKVIADYDTDPHKVIFVNSADGTHSNVFQAEANMNLFRLVDLKLAYKFVESRYKLNGITYDQPFNSKDRVLTTFSYSPADNSFLVSAGVQWYGSQRLPSTESNPLEYRRPLTSDPYTIVNAQFNKNFSFLELYLGVENLLDFMQPNPIIAANDPFGEYFDTSFIWGPTKGREFYFGFRFLLQ